MPRHLKLAAAAAGGAAFLLYRSTMLPGVEWGDSASFQVMVGSPTISPRDGYPLYFALAAVLDCLVPGSPAHVLNLASAIEGALACSLVVLAAYELAGSVPAAAAASLLFAVSYTFWSQSVIAEVYALHILFVALTMWLLLRWSSSPTTRRLTLFLAVYAVSFGHHLTMILFLPAYAMFMLASAPGGWRTLLTVRHLIIAALCIATGAMPYLWNLQALWLSPAPPPTLLEGLRVFWLDVTKADWRDSMMFGVPAAMAAERLRMYVFDVVQQFGWAGVSLAAGGICALARAQPRRAALLLMAWALNAGFALTYNVGDTHVFLLPSHLMLAFAAASGIIAAGRVTGAPIAVTALVFLLIGVRAYRERPALDRSADARPRSALAALTAGLDDRRAILLTDLNWQAENALHYFVRRDAPQVASERLSEVLPYAPALIADNASIGREVVVDARATARLAATHGPLVTATPDMRTVSLSVGDAARRIAPGTRYAICLVRPSREFMLDRDALAETLAALTGGSRSAFRSGEFAVIAGVAGQPPILDHGSDQPFHVAAALDGLRVHVRMESWLAFDTFRRMGFGHVIGGREHSLIVERGISFVAMDEAGRPVQSAYDASIFAAQPRFIVTVAVPPG